MILFASGRCDIPAFYSTWFFNRINAGFVDVRNPFNPHQISRIALRKETIDVIIFCTKNPLPMLPHIQKIPFPYLFHVTITPYHTDIEPNVIGKDKVIKAVHTLSSLIGKDRVIVRYDPILLNANYTIAYHERAFTKLCKQLQGSIFTIIISFVDNYKNTRANQRYMNLLPIREDDMREIARRFASIAKKYQMHIQTCAEHVDLRAYGIENRPCMNMIDLRKAIGKNFPQPKGRGVRKDACACLASVDIGDYNCCFHACYYCYANYDAKRIEGNQKLHDPTSTVLLGHVEEGDHIVVREEKKVRQCQLEV